MSSCIFLKPYIYFTKGSTPSNCQYNQCNPVQISITIPASQGSYPSLSRFYGTEAEFSGTDPIDYFEMHFITPPPPKVGEVHPLLPLLNPPLTKPFLASYPMIKLAIVEVKDLKQILATEIGYQDAKAWLEWINILSTC